MPSPPPELSANGKAKKRKYNKKTDKLKRK
jgi:hypothetical protein